MASGVLVTSLSPLVPTVKRGDMCANLPGGAVGFPASSWEAAQLRWLMLFQNSGPLPSCTFRRLAECRAGGEPCVGRS